MVLTEAQREDDPDETLVGSSPEFPTLQKPSPIATKSRAKFVPLGTTKKRRRELDEQVAEVQSKRFKDLATKESWLNDWHRELQEWQGKLEAENLALQERSREIERREEADVKAITDYNKIVSDMSIEVVGRVLSLEKKFESVDRKLCGSCRVWEQKLRTKQEIFEQSFNARWDSLNLEQGEQNFSLEERHESRLMSLEKQMKELQEQSRVPKPSEEDVAVRPALEGCNTVGDNSHIKVEQQDQMREGQIPDTAPKPSRLQWQPSGSPAAKQGFPVSAPGHNQGSRRISGGLMQTLDASRNAEQYEGVCSPKTALSRRL